MNNMAFQRLPWKFRISVRPRYLIVAAALLLPVTLLHAGTSEMFVSDRLTGVAISGYDPVSYFTGTAPVQGRRELESVLENVVFQFRNEGNRAAFVAHPDIYAPQYGGHDPVALARGIALAGNPLEWQIFGSHLYLFYDPRSRAAFAADPKAAIAKAEEQWPEVRKGLIR
jgi:hypothetical protein